MLMAAQIQDGVYMLMTSLGPQLKWVSTLNQETHIFKPLRAVSEKTHPCDPLPAAPCHCPRQMEEGSLPSPPSCPSKQKCGLKMKTGPREAVHSSWKLWGESRSEEFIAQCRMLFRRVPRQEVPQEISRWAMKGLCEESMGGFINSAT